MSAPTVILAPPSAPTTLTESTSVAPPSQQRAHIGLGSRGVMLENLDALVRFSQILARSGLAPKGLQTPESICIAVQMGLEVGLTPMAALQNIAVINGRPTIWGDAQLAIVRGTGELEQFEEWYESGGKRLARNPSEFKDDTTAVCSVKRRGFAAVESAYTVADAKRAGLWGKDSPWSTAPARMLRFRARSFGLRDTFGDALRGIKTTEEAQDEAERDVTPHQQERDAMQMLSDPSAPIAALPPAQEAVAPHTQEMPPIINRLKPKAETPPPAVTVTEHTTAPKDDAPLGVRIKEAMESSDIPLQGVAAFARASKVHGRSQVISVHDFDDKAGAFILAHWDEVCSYCLEEGHKK